MIPFQPCFYRTVNTAIFLNFPRWHSHMPSWLLYTVSEESPGRLWTYSYCPQNNIHRCVNLLGKFDKNKRDMAYTARSVPKWRQAVENLSSSFSLKQLNFLYPGNMMPFSSLLLKQLSNNPLWKRKRNPLNFSQIGLYYCYLKIFSNYMQRILLGRNKEEGAKSNGPF